MTTEAAEERIKLLEHRLAEAKGQIEILERERKVKEIATLSKLNRDGLEMLRIENDNLKEQIQNMKKQIIRLSKLIYPVSGSQENAILDSSKDTKTLLPKRR